METLRLKSHIDSDGHLRIDVPTNLAGGEVELVLIIQTLAEDHGRRRHYDFSDLAGRFRWRGNPVETQRQLRDEGNVCCLRRFLVEE